MSNPGPYAGIFLFLNRLVNGDFEEQVASIGKKL